MKVIASYKRDDVASLFSYTKVMEMINYFDEDDGHDDDDDEDDGHDDDDDEDDRHDDEDSGNE